MRCKQRAFSFDKSMLLGCKNFLLKIHPKIIFINALFLLANQFSEVIFFSYNRKTEIHNFPNLTAG